MTCMPGKVIRRKLISLFALTALLAQGITAYAVEIPADSDGEYALPQFVITTDNGEGGSYEGSLTKPMGYVKAGIIVTDVDGTELVSDDNAQIKVRGNSTADGEKKPYNIKLSNKEDLFGFGKSKSWTLLADWYDPTLMRNALALDLAGELGCVSTMDHRPVEVTMDGRYQGLYLLTEKIAVDKKRVDINPDNGDFLVEMDVTSRTEDDEVYFFTDDRQYYCLKAPENPSDEELAAVKDKMSELHTVLASGDYSEVEQLIDVDSFVSYYLLNEFLQTCDFGGKSVYFYYKGGKIYAGVPWDFDLSSGLFFNSRWTSWGAHAAKCHYYNQLMEYPQFVSEVYQKYQSSKAIFCDTYQEDGWIDRHLSRYGEAIDRNWEQAPVAYRDLTYDEQVNYLRNWLSERDAWLEWYLKKLATGEAEVSHADEVPATCTTDGCKEYYTVEGSGHKFSDPQCINEVSDSALIIGASHRFMTDQGEVVPCAATGIEEGSCCSVCGEVISELDETGRSPHKVVIDPAVAPTAFSEGLTEGKHCSVCGLVIEAQERIPVLQVISQRPDPNPYYDALDDSRKALVPGGYVDNSGSPMEMPELDCGWNVVNGKSYWYEAGIKQGTYYDNHAVIGDRTVRGREIYDPGSDAWYWLDANACGAKAIGKEVWMPYVYQDEDKWDDEKKASVAKESDPYLDDIVLQAMKNKSGKWVRYDENGAMLKGWVIIEGALAELYPDQVGNIYYYDKRTGMMIKGSITIDGRGCHFDEITGALDGGSMPTS